MNSPQPEQPHSPVVVRAEELLDRTAHGIGFFASRTRLRIQQATNYIREEADRLDQPKTMQTRQQNQPGVASQVQPNSTTDVQGEAATQRAEQIVDSLGQRITSFAAITSLQVQRAVARLREDAEDLWAEAKSIDHKNDRPSQPSQ